jgi:hypothetical protein
MKRLIRIGMDSLGIEKIYLKIVLAMSAFLFLRFKSIVDLTVAYTKT